MPEVLDLTNLNVRNFSRFFLADNPFPAIAVAEDNPVKMVDRERIMTTIRDTIVTTFQTGRSQTLVVIGKYGSGKSHVLKYTKSRINTQLGALKDRKAIGVYLESPRDSFRSLYSEVLQDLGEGFAKELAYRVIADYILASPGSLDGLIPDTQNEVRIAAEVRDKLARSPSSFDSFVTRTMIRHLDLFSRIRAVHERETKLPEYLPVFLGLASPITESSAWRWLTGEQLLKSERELLGVSTPLEEDRGLDAFHDFKLILGLAGFQMLFLLLDELEKISELHYNLRGRYLDDLRHFIDGNTEGMCLIACVTQTGFSELEASGHPLYRRLLTANQTLVPFDARLTGELIRAYLQDSRELYRTKNGIAEPDMRNNVLQQGGDYDLYPFTEGVLSRIRDLSQGNIGDILANCRKLLDAACDDPTISRIDSEDFVSRIIEPVVVEE